MWTVTVSMLLVFVVAILFIFNLGWRIANLFPEKSRQTAMTVIQIIVGSFAAWPVSEMFVEFVGQARPMHWVSHLVAVILILAGSFGIGAKLPRPE
jgi:hypothetical protein